MAPSDCRRGCAPHQGHPPPSPSACIIARGRGLSETSLQYGTDTSILIEPSVFRHGLLNRRPVIVLLDRNLAGLRVTLSVRLRVRRHRRQARAPSSARSNDPERCRMRGKLAATVSADRQAHVGDLETTTRQRADSDREPTGTLLSLPRGPPACPSYG